MSIESAQKFYETIQKDDALRIKIEAAKKEEQPQIIKDAGYDFTQDELKKVLASNTELSADDLINISGGCYNTGSIHSDAVETKWNVLQ